MHTSSFSPMESLHAEHQAIADLLALMKQEQASLIGADADKLIHITEQKTKLVNLAADLAKQRHAAMEQAGFSALESNMPAWIASIKQENITKAWEDLLAITRSAKELNRLNGMLINKQLANTQNAMQALHAPVHGTAQNFYGPSGHATAPPATRRLVVG